MLALNELQAQYITDDAGKRSAVVIPIEQFNQLLEDISDLAVMAERREEPDMFVVDRRLSSRPQGRH